MDFLMMLSYTVCIMVLCSYLSGYHSFLSPLPLPAGPLSSSLIIPIYFHFHLYKPRFIYMQHLSVFLLPLSSRGLSSSSLYTLSLFYHVVSFLLPLPRFSPVSLFPSYLTIRVWYFPIFSFLLSILGTESKELPTQRSNLLLCLQPSLWLYVLKQSFTKFSRLTLSSLLIQESLKLVILLHCPSESLGYRPASPTQLFESSLFHLARWLLVPHTFLQMNNFILLFYNVFVYMYVFLIVYMYTMCM